MDRHESPILTLDINLRLLAALGLLGALFVFAISYVSAQEDTPGSPTQVSAGSSSELPPDTGTEPAVMRRGDQVYSANGEWIALGDQGAPQSGETSSAVAAAGGDKLSFYLTEANYAADQVLGACASGYHMASLWEILDVSNLAYAADHPQAYTKADSGSGPPAFWNGWVRTGWNNSAEDTAGKGNCNNWSQKSSGHGTIVRLINDWETTQGELFTWDATSWQCTSVSTVWCVEDRAP